MSGTVKALRRNINRIQRDNQRGIAVLAGYAQGVYFGYGDGFHGLIGL